MERDMENIIKDAEFDEVLRKREVILQQNKQWEGTIAWRPTGSPIEDLRSRDMEVLQKKAQQMEEMCQAEDNEVNALQSEVEALWKRILSTEDTFNNSGVMFQTFLDQLVNDEVALSHNTNILYTV